MQFIFSCLFCIFTNSASMEEYRYTTCVLKVNTQSSGWEESLTKVIKRFKGVSYTIDTIQGVIRISGRMDPNKVLNDIKKAGKHAELIHVDCGDGNHPYNHDHHDRDYHNRTFTHAHGYGYDDGYGMMEHQQYGHFYDVPRNGFIEPSAPEPRRALLLPPPSAPPALPGLDNFEPYNHPSCNLM